MRCFVRKSFLAVFLLCLFILGCSKLPKTESKSDILGIRINMSKENAHKRLNEIGRLEKEESKQQEVWTLNNDPSYSNLIVAFTREDPAVRFVTAKAREDGTRVRYSEVLDLEKSQQIGSANNYKYIQEFPADEKTSGYSIIASGKDQNFLTYLSLKDLTPSESEEEEEDDE